MRLGGIEFGGTKTVCVVGTAGQVEDEVRFATGADPAANLATCVEFFRRYDDVAAVGVGAFGPCDPDPTSPTYGFVTTTPKPGWANVDVLGVLREGLPGVAMAFDTDVNVAALGELGHGAGKGLNSVVYLTTGTGIGGGLVADGHLVHGLLHPEMGHIPIPRPLAEIEVFAGVCPYHGDCLEGVASGPALAARWGSPAQDIGPDDDRYEVMCLGPRGALPGCGDAHVRLHRLAPADHLRWGSGPAGAVASAGAATPAGVVERLYPQGRDPARHRQLRGGTTARQPLRWDRRHGTGVLAGARRVTPAHAALGGVDGGGR